MKGDHQFVDGPLERPSEVLLSEPQPERLQTSLEVLPLVDELVESRGFGPRSMYTEMCWLPVMGPTATWLYRRLGSWAEYHPDGVQVGLVDLSLGLGLGEGIGSHSKLAKAFERLERFDAAKWSGNQLLVRRALAPLPQRYVQRLSYTAHAFHQASVGNSTTAQPVVYSDNIRHNGRQKGGGR